MPRDAISPAGFTIASSPPGMRMTRWLTPAECAASDPRGYIVKSLIAPGDLMLIFGEPGLGKSCIAPRIAYAVAQGADVFGRRVRQGRVLYVAAEDAHGMRARIAALRSELGDTPDLLMAEGLSDFMTPDGPHQVALAAKIEAFEPSLVIIDTIAAGFPGLQENDSGREGMGRVVGFARAMIADFGVAVMLVHHTPKGDAATPRGHGSLHGDADVGLALSRDDTGLIRAAFTKNRNGPSDGALAFTIRPVTLGMDEDGDPITAPIAEPADDPDRSGPRLPPQARNALGFLWDLLASEGVDLPSGAGFPTSRIKGVWETRWRDECESRRLSTSDEPESRKRVFRTAFQRLRNAGAIGARDGWVWSIPRDLGSTP